MTSLAIASLGIAAAPQVIRVERGDTLWGLSRRYDTTVAELKRLNSLPGDTIYAGDTLLIPGSGRAGATVDHLVRRGETVTGLASRYDVSINDIVALNGLSSEMVIYAGQVLRVPVPRAPTPAAVDQGDTRPQPAPSEATPPPRDYPPHVTAAAKQHRAELENLPDPSPQEVRALVRATSIQLGLDPAVALAVAQQESGFQMNVVSPADAIGVMQVLPSTGRWVGRDLVGRPLDLMNIRDNVLAGVSLLRALTRVAPLEQAIAGYYQGLTSVRANGMYPDTRRYVANVLALAERWR